MYTILLGTYTKKSSKGIYQVELSNNALANLKHIATTSNPTYLDYDTDSDTVFSIIQDDDKGGVAQWRYNKGAMTYIGSLLQNGSAPCYVSYDKYDDQVYDANYHLGRVTVYKDNLIFKKIEYYDGSHAHFVQRKENTEFVYVADLGLDTIRKYELMNEIATYKAADGTGPRHLAFHPTLPIIYAIGEHSATITVLEDDGFDLFEIQTIDILDDITQSRSGAAIRISKDGKYLYASNRIYNIISVFKISDNGKDIQRIQTISTFGDHPRDFDLSPDNANLVCANRDSNSLTLFKRNVDGTLTLLEKDIYCPECVCVKFI